MNHHNPWVLGANAPNSSDLLTTVVESRSALANTLRDLQDIGLVKRQVKSTRPVQREYHLTERGSPAIGLLTKVNEVLAKD